MASCSPEKNPGLKQPRKSRIKAWGQLISVLLLLWVFGTVVGPWLETRIPTFDKIVETIEKHDIDSGAYFYSEIKGSYDGERYLRDALELGAPDEIGLTFSFVSGIVLCLVILWIGFRYMPLE
jgi:hypothetical protein